MLIYVFTVFYTSLYKSYFDTQFEAFIREGHKLKIFSSSVQGEKLEEKVIKLNLYTRAKHYPTTLRTIPRHVLTIVKNILISPVARSKSIRIGLSDIGSVKYKLLNVMRILVFTLEQPDLSLIHNLIAALQMPFLKNIYKNTPVAFYYHGGEVAGAPQIEYSDAKEAFSCVDRVFTNSSNSREHAISRGCNPEDIYVSPVGFNLDKFIADESKVYKANGILELLTIGRMNKEKGHVFALEAIKILVDEGVTDIHYKLIGSGPLLGNLKEYVIKNKLDKYIEFLGYLHRARSNAL